MSVRIAGPGFAQASVHLLQEPPPDGKAAVAKAAVMEVEINNESAASLNHSVTAHNFQSAQLPVKV